MNTIGDWLEKLVKKLPWLTPRGWLVVGSVMFWIFFAAGYAIHTKLWEF